MALSDGIKLRIAELVDRGAKDLMDMGNELYASLPSGSTPSVVYRQQFDSDEEYRQIAGEVKLYFEAMKVARLEWMVKKADEKLAKVRG